VPCYLVEMTAPVPLVLATISTSETSSVSMRLHGVNIPEPLRTSHSSSNLTLLKYSASYFRLNKYQDKVKVFFVSWYPGKTSIICFGKDVTRRKKSVLGSSASKYSLFVY
jgi:hypothetical protein